MHDFLRSSVSKEHLYYCLSPSLSLSQGWPSRLYPTMANLKKISQETKQYRCKSPISSIIFLCKLVVLSFVILGVMSWTYGPWEISLSCSTLYKNAGGGTSQGSLDAKKAMSQACYRHQIHSLVQGLLLTQILFDNEKKFRTQNLLVRFL